MNADQLELISRATQAIELAKDEKGLLNLCTSTQAAIRELQAEQDWLDTNESNPAQTRFVAAKQSKVLKATYKITDNVLAISTKLDEMAEKERAKEENAAGPDTEYVQRATALIGVIANSTADVTPSDLLAMAIPEHVSKYVQSRGLWYERGPNGSVEQVIEDELAEEIANALQAQQFGRTVGTALDIARNGEVPLSVGPVLKTWSSHMRDYTRLYQSLPSDETMKVCDDLFPIVIDGANYTLARKTGQLTENPPDGCRVLYPAIIANSSGESRALDDLVHHHFKSDEEAEAFYKTCGLSLFGYGIPNLVFLLGRGGSGKDALFSLMRAVHSERLVHTINALALMGHDESNDLVRLQSARLALCSFESSHRADGSFKPSVLKSITSGGANPITARAKYAKQAVDIFYHGSLWLYGNRVPNLTGGGDFDGLDRRFMILPMTKKLPEVPPPTGFTTWTEAIVACAPVFAWRCLNSFILWHKAGTPGYSDVRKRIPEEWRSLSNEHLMAGSRFGFLRDLFMPSAEQGLKQTTIYEVLGAIMKQEGIRMGRSRFHDILKDTISDRARFDGKRHMEAEMFDGIERLPITVVPSALKKLLDVMNIGDAMHALNTDGNWHPDIVEAAQRFNTEAQLRARLYGGTE